MQYALDILDFAMTMEQEGKYFFTEWAGRVKNPATKQIFSELANWEEEHWQYLAGQRSALEQTGKIIPADATIAAAEQKALETFYNRGQGISGSASVTSGLGDLSALRLAITIEHDLHQFYGQAATNAQDPDLREMFAMLSKWELNHRTILEHEYGTLRQRFWDKMGFIPF